LAVSEEARKTLIGQAISAAGDHPETLRVPWRGSQQKMPVIQIRISAVLLNPRSHRIKAQLESDPKSAKLIESDPESDEAQEVIAKLLRETAGFEALKQNLKDEQQKDPGIITRGGLLVNANTRAVALRDLGIEYIEVAVLPSDAQPEEIYDLELDLQVAQDYRTDYTFTNELLFIDDMITKLNRDEESVACRLRWATPTKASSLKTGAEKVRRYVRHLALIREIQDLSGSKIPITYFDDATQALQEFDTAYEALRDTNPAAADRLKNGRILGLLVDLGYDRQRMVNSDWMESHLQEAFSENDFLAPLISPILAQAGQAGGESVEEPSDFDLFPAPDSDVDAHDVHVVVTALVDALSTSADEEFLTLPSVQGSMRYPREQVKAAVYDAMRTAAEDAKAAARAGNALALPAELISEAASRLNKARDAFNAVKDLPEFDDATLRANLGKLERAREALNEAMGD
jgi:hypothetical protein